MKLKSIAANQTVVNVGHNEVFFSYETPVAAFISGQGYVATEEYYSKTTSRHIGNYIGIPYKECKKVAQSVINNLVK